MLLVTYIALYIFGNIITALLKNYYLLFIILYLFRKSKTTNTKTKHMTYNIHTLKRNETNKTKRNIT